MGRLGGVLGFLLSIIICLVPHASALEASGELGLELRLFPESPNQSVQHNTNFSGYFQPEFYHKWDNGKQSVTFEPFVRVDQNDDERTHFDIREFFWEKAADQWELRVGLRKVFWGVAETQHLVDIINQTDLVENPDTEDKLGQPMVNLAIIQDWGTIDLFALPFFRERTFPGIEGRFRTPLVVDTDNALYESGAEDHRLDLAARYSHYIGPFDFGLAHFSGTSRDPTLLPRANSAGQLVLIPFYEVINQTSLDAQATLGSWLLKLEALARRGQGKPYHAFVGGFEYTFVGIMEKAWDLGVLAEYHFDERDEKSPNPLEDDFFLGGRFVLNDTQSTELLGGIVLDRSRGLTSAFIETSRRLNDFLKLNIEVRTFYEDASSDPISAFEEDDTLQLDLIYYY